MTTPQLTQVEYAGGDRLHLTFADGTEGEIDLKDELWRAVFEPLRAVDAFKRLELNRELNTICWETGADFAPEFLYEAIRKKESAA